MVILFRKPDTMHSMPKHGFKERSGRIGQAQELTESEIRGLIQESEKLPSNEGR